MINLLYNKKNIKTASKILENKTFVLNYPKFFVRSSLNKNYSILDNSFDISSSLNKIHYNNNLGSSIIVNKLLYKHKLYKNLKFYWFNPSINLSEDLNCYLNNMNSKNYIFFTRIIRGGIHCYTAGFKGILPKEQVKVLVKYQKNIIITSRLTFCFLLKSDTKFFFFKPSVELSKVTMYSASWYIKHKNLYTKSSKFHITFKCTNNLINYENKKINKKNRKYYFRKKNKKF